MTRPLSPPPRKNPQRRTRQPLNPPSVRSRAALGLTAAAAVGRFMLQRCNACGAVLYPPSDACVKCLSVDLEWQELDPYGKLIAETRVRTSVNLYFQERLPWRICTVKLDVGPSVICHAHGDCEKNQRVRIINRLDKAGQGVLMAIPVHKTRNFEDDPQMRELTCHPKYRRILITDGRDPGCPALAEAFIAAQAETVFVGEAENWRPNPNRRKLSGLGKVELLPLDVTDTHSVNGLAGEIGGKVDILVNNARFIRPGGLLERGNLTFAREEIEVNYLGLMRLAQAFAPAMRGRGADGDNSAVAWVNILSVYAHANWPAYGPFNASHAAALSLSQCLRAEFRSSGVRVVNAFTGPTDDEWHQQQPPPKVSHGRLAAVLVKALQDGLEDVCIGDVAQDVMERWRAGAKVLERELITQTEVGQ